VTVTVVLNTFVVVVVNAVTRELSPSGIDDKTFESESPSTLEEVPNVTLAVPETSRLEAVSVPEMPSVVISAPVKRLEMVTDEALVEESSVSSEAVPIMLVESEARLVTAEEPVLMGEVLLFQAVDT
jgi:hypothetical protein